MNTGINPNTGQPVSDIEKWQSWSAILSTLSLAALSIYGPYKLFKGAGGGKASGAENIQKVTEPNYVPRDVNGKELGLPRYDNGKIVNGTSHIPESQFPHSQIGIKGGRNGEYIQTLEWGYDGKPIQRTDWTNHGRADHTNPHSHPAILKDGSWSFKK